MSVRVCFWRLVWSRVKAPSSHTTGLSVYVWGWMCCLKWDWSTILKAHSLHAIGISSVWVRVCFLRSDASLVFAQLLHANSFSLV